MSSSRWSLSRRSTRRCAYQKKLRPWSTAGATADTTEGNCRASRDLGFVVFTFTRGLYRALASAARVQGPFLIRVHPFILFTLTPDELSTWVNPNPRVYSTQVELVEAFDQALRMAPAERSARALKDLAHIQRCTLEEFANRFVCDLKSMKTKREEDFVSVGFGLASFR